MEHHIFDDIDNFQGCVIETSDEEENSEYNDENTRNTPVLKVSQEPNKYSNKCTLLEFVNINKVSIEEIRDLYNQKNTKANFNKLLDNKFKVLKNKWFNKDHSNLHAIHILQLALRNLEIGDKSVTQQLISEGYQKNEYEAVALFHAYAERNLLTEELKRNFDHIFENIYYSMNLIQNLYCYKRALNPNYETYVCDEMCIYRFTPPDSSKNTPFQNLILYLLNTIYKRRYRRYPPTGDISAEGEKYCYKEIYTKDGYYTYAWKKEVSIERLVYKYCKKELNYEQWHNLTVDKTNARNSISFLSKTDDPQFQELVKNRSVFSFQNGVYLAKNYNSTTGKYYDRFYKYGTYPSLENNIVAAKYFKKNFNMYENLENWYDIPTPFLQSILDFQFSDESEYIEISKWMYIMIGRMLYEVGDLDDWQVIGFIKGIAGTGKGTILTKIIKRFYEPDDVGVLSNDGETQFGLSGFHNKTIFLAPEIKGDLKLPQASFQSIVSGEDLVVPVKYKTPQNLVWKTPGFLAGNETPNYTDNSGSLSRRLLIWSFMKKIPKKSVDPLLGKKLQDEIPIIIAKCNKGYLDSINKYGARNIWDVLPKYFLKNQQELSKDTNSLMSFLESGNIEFADGIYTRETTFKQAFNVFCKDNNYKPIKYNKDLYSLPYQICAEKHNVKIEVLKTKKFRYPRKGGNVCHGTFITGIDLIQEDVDEDPDDFFNF